MAGESPAAVLADGVNGIETAVVDDVVIPANTRAYLMAGESEDASKKAMIPTVTVDPIDGRRRQSIEGKVSVVNPVAPPAATAVQIASDTPLDISSDQDDDFVITDAKTFTLQSVTAGSEGDSTEKGSVIEVFYSADAGVTLKIIERIYINGQTVTTFPDTSTARDGTSMDGDGAGDGIIRVRRRRLSGGSQEVDAVARGFEQ